LKKYICRSPGCKALLDEPSYCVKHKHPANTAKPFENASRSNEPFYNTVRWKRLRKEHLKENDYCTRCGSRESLTADHIIPPLGIESLFFDADNLQTLCGTCNRIKTQKEIEERKKRRRNC
jgi:5-methylcytosine-specific restriction protein A